MMSSLLKEAQVSLAANGGRMTAQRRLILETLEEVGGHPTAEELFALLKPQSRDLNLSTVYRTLRWLEGEGLVGSRWFGEDRQERFDLALPSEHHHFVCRTCQQVIEFNHSEIERLKTEFEKTSGALVESASVVLSGLCGDCRENRPFSE